LAFLDKIRSRLGGGHNDGGQGETARDGAERSEAGLSEAVRDGASQSTSARSKAVQNNTEQLWVVAGLGNPGDRYSTTRHNAGFIAADALAAELGIAKWRARFESLVAEHRLTLNGAPALLVLAKPQTMMNRSGRAVKGLLKHYGVGLESLIVIHDDIDLPCGTLRIKSGGGHGGHNGIRDIIGAVGAEFTRIKTGVGSPPGRMDSADYVLQLLKGELLEELRIDAARASDAALYLMEHDLIQAQNHYN